MSDETPQQDDVEKVEQPVGQEDQPKMFDEAYVKKLRDEAASYRVKLKEYEDAQKTEAERLSERIAELEKENKQFRVAKQRAEWAQEIVKDSTVPADALRGDTQEELQAHFEQLKPLVKPTDEPAPKKGAWAPFDPDEGKSPSGSMTTNADRFAEFLGNKLS